MNIRLKFFSFRFAEQVLNSNLPLKQEVEQILTDPRIELRNLSRPRFNAILDQLFSEKGWQRQPAVFDENIDG